MGTLILLIRILQAAHSPSSDHSYRTDYNYQLPSIPQLTVKIYSVKSCFAFCFFHIGNLHIFSCRSHWQGLTYSVIKKTGYFNIDETFQIFTTYVIMYGHRYHDCAASDLIEVNTERVKIIIDLSDRVVDPDRWNTKLLYVKIRIRNRYQYFLS